MMGQATDSTLISLIVNVVEKDGSMQLASPLSTDVKCALERRGYQVTSTKVNLN